MENIPITEFKFFIEILYFFIYLYIYHWSTYLFINMLFLTVAVIKGRSHDKRKKKMMKEHKHWLTYLCIRHLVLLNLPPWTRLFPCLPPHLVPCWKLWIVQILFCKNVLAILRVQAEIFKFWRFVIVWAFLEEDLSKGGGDILNIIFVNGSYVHLCV